MSEYKHEVNSATDMTSPAGIAAKIKRLMDAPEFICPITKQRFNDPVICSDGLTYEFSAITSRLSQVKFPTMRLRVLGVNRNIRMAIERTYEIRLPASSFVPPPGKNTFV